MIILNLAEPSASTPIVTLRFLPAGQPNERNLFEGRIKDAIDKTGKKIELSSRNKEDGSVVYTLSSEQKGVAERIKTKAAVIVALDGAGISDSIPQSELARR